VNETRGAKGTKKPDRTSKTHQSDQEQGAGGGEGIYHLLIRRERNAVLWTHLDSWELFRRDVGRPPNQKTQKEKDDGNTTKKKNGAYRRLRNTQITVNND